jgi:hypothetical protein
MKIYYDEKLQDYIYDTGIEVVTVASVKPTLDYKLNLTFSTGEKKIYNCSKLLNLPVFQPLSNKAFFMRAHTDGITVAWNDVIDIAPEELYENSIAL